MLFMEEDVIEKDNSYVITNFPELTDVRFPQLLVKKFFRSKHQSYMYKRAAATYTHLRSPFLCPVWAAKEVDDSFVIVSPHLTPLRDILGRGHTDCRFLHSVFFPIAMAIDTLHTVVPGRSYLFHRDVCLKNVVMPEGKSENGQIIYGGARLKLTDLTKPIHSEESAENSQILPEYYHPQPVLGQNVYTKEQDWYSYGIFIIEVFFELFTSLEKESKLFEYKPFDRNTLAKYCEILQIMKDYCKERMAERVGEISNEYILSYLEVAEKCIDMKTIKKPVSKWPVENTGTKTTHNFEYEINEVAAQLYEFYKKFGESGLERYHNKYFQEEKLCHSCLTADTVNIPTFTFGAENKSCCRTCTDTDSKEYMYSTWNACKYYCSTCYRNREKKFCPQHGPVSTVLGHISSYALLFYGEEFNVPNKRRFFEEDANKLRNWLVHQQVGGMRMENIIMKGLDVLDPLPLLKEAVDAMREKIHNAQKPCTNNRKYELLIYYSGHGYSKEKPGTWQPKKDITISSGDIQEQLTRMRACENEQCRKSCAQIIYLMDHCYPDSAVNYTVLSRQDDHTPRHLIIEVYLNKETFYDEKASCSESLRSYITHRFCDVLLGKGKKQSKDMIDSSKRLDLVTAEEMPKEIEIFICNEDRTQKLNVQNNAEECQYILAYRNAAEVKYTIHRLFGAETLEWAEFTEDITLSLVEESVKQKLKALKMLESGDTVVLLTNLTSDCTKHTLVWDHHLQIILERAYINDGSHFFPALVYYQVINQQDLLQIDLQVTEQSEQKTIMLPVSKKFLPKKGVDQDLLPNLLVYIVHYLYREQAKDEPIPNDNKSSSRGTGVSSESTDEPKPEQDKSSSKDPAVSSESNDEPKPEQDKSSSRDTGVSSESNDEPKPEQDKSSSRGTGVSSESTDEPKPEQDKSSSRGTGVSSESTDARHPFVFESFIRKIDKQFLTLPYKTNKGSWVHLGEVAANKKIILVFGDECKDNVYEDDAFVFHLANLSLEWKDDTATVKPSSVQVVEDSFNDNKMESDTMTTSDEGFEDLTNSMLSETALTDSTSVPAEIVLTDSNSMLAETGLTDSNSMLAETVLTDSNSMLAEIVLTD